MRDKITAGIICYNEADWILACLNGASKVAGKIIITDGLMEGTSVEAGKQRNPICQPSYDGTNDIIKNWGATHPRGSLIEFNLWGDRTPTEREIRNVQMSMCDTEYFMIIDADEIWTQEEAEKLWKAIEENPDIDNFAIPNKLWIWNPYTYIQTKNWRLFKIGDRRVFVGNNEVEPSSNQLILNKEQGNFYHYGYIDRDKVKRKMDLYSSETYYRNLGPLWFENVYSAFPGKNIETLIRDNFGSLHPFSRIHPGFAYNEWGKVIEEFPSSHPIDMRQYFDKRNYRKNILYVQ